MTNSLNFPSGAPLVGADGRLSPVWFQFFLTLFRRSGDEQGGSLVDVMVDAAGGTSAPDLTRLYAMLPMLESGHAQPDLAAIYSLIYAVEAMAAQAIATGPLLDRIASLEARIDEMAAATLTDTALLSNGAQFLAAPNNLSDVASATTARANLGLKSMAIQAANTVAVTGGAIDGTTVGTTTPAAAKFTKATLTSTADEYALQHLGGVVSGGKTYAGFMAGPAAATNQSGGYGYVYDSSTPNASFFHLTPYGAAEGSKFKVDILGNLTTAAGFGCNGKAAQAAYSVGAAATDATSTQALANNLRSALLANGICV